MGHVRIEIAHHVVYPYKSFYLAGSMLAIRLNRIYEHLILTIPNATIVFVRILKYEQKARLLLNHNRNLHQIQSYILIRQRQILC